MATNGSEISLSSTPSTERRYEPKPPRKPPLTKSMLTASEIAHEISLRAERKRQSCPDGVDVFVAMQQASQIRIPTLLETTQPQTVPLDSGPPPGKLPKLRDENKVLNAAELLTILQDGAQSHYVEKPRYTPAKAKKSSNTMRGPRGIPKDLNIDPELERELALKQLMEVSRRKSRPRNAETNNNNSKTGSSTTSDASSPLQQKPKKRNSELQKLLQDEGAINMLYEMEKGESESKERFLSSKRRLKKVLKKKAQEVESAILEASSSRSEGSSVRLRAQDKSISRKASIDSIESEHSSSLPRTHGQDQNSFRFAAPAEASKIIRRHSSSSSYSSRGNSPSPVRQSEKSSPTTPTDTSPVVSSPTAATPEASPVKNSSISERTEKLIEMKCRELNLQPEHSDLIKQLIKDKKNGLKERLQTELTNKFKAVVNSPVSSPKPNAKNTTPVSLKTIKAEANTPKPVWKQVEEDWDTADEVSDNDKDAANKPDSLNVKKEIQPFQPDGDVEEIVEESASVFLIKPEQNSPSKDQPSEPDIRIESVVQLPASAAVIKTSEPNLPAMLLTNLSIALNKRKSLLTPKPLPAPFPGSEVRLERHDSVVKVNIAPTSSRLPQAMNAKVLSELYQALDYLEQAGDTKAIILSCPSSSSTASSWVYCNGVDLPSLLDDDKDRRKLIAAETATALKDLMTKMAMVGRPIITGVSGQAVGLGAVMLAYCDYVLADETSLFYTPYALLGYMPEAAASLILPGIIGPRQTASLLLACSKLDCHEAAMCGLITKVVPKVDLQQRVMDVAKQITQHSVQSMKSTKALLMHGLRSKLPSTLVTESRILEQHWASDDCQARIKDMSINPLF